MKVEKAVQVLPSLEVMAPVRALLLTSGLMHAGVAIPGKNLTIGKREVAPAEMRQRMAREFERITAHIASLFESWFLALEALDAGLAEQAVSHLLGAGHREETADRLSQAHVWYSVALGVADGLQDRRPEIRTLLAIAQLSRRLGFFDDATRRYRRALVLAESEFDESGAISACTGLGSLLADQRVWAGAEAWYSRALRLATAARDDEHLGHIHHGLGDLARRRGDHSAATDALRKAREKFEALGNTLGMARTLTTQGRLFADMGSLPRSAAAYREALAWARRSNVPDAQEVVIRMSSARLYLDAGRFLEAEKEIRRAERLAITNSLVRRLAQLYTLLGELRGRENDETGFVFFEQALQLARMLDRRPIVEGKVYRAYGAFKQQMHQPDEANAYLQRAREIFESVGAQAELERLMSEGNLSKV